MYLPSEQLRQTNVLICLNRLASTDHPCRIQSGPAVWKIHFICYYMDDWQSKKRNSVKWHSVISKWKRKLVLDITTKGWELRPFRIGWWQYPLPIIYSIPEQISTVLWFLLMPGSHGLHWSWFDLNVEWVQDWILLCYFLLGWIVTCGIWQEKCAKKVILSVTFSRNL